MCDPKDPSPKASPEDNSPQDSSSESSPADTKTPWKPKTPRVASPARMALHQADPLSPAVILVRPQLGENIGTVARAMLNTGLDDLRLVKPRIWPSEHAEKAASGALSLLENARLFDSTAEAVADLSRLYATTARERDMVKPVVTPRKAAADIRGLAEMGGRCGVLFGRERSGLENEDIALADVILQVPLNPAFTSLNLAQAVLLIGYEWWSMEDVTPEDKLALGHTVPATKEEILGFFEHLESALDESGFLRPLEKRPRMVRNLRNLFTRCSLTDQEVRTLRGVVKSLSDRRKRPSP